MRRTTIWVALILALAVGMLVAPGAALASGSIVADSQGSSQQETTAVESAVYAAAASYSAATRAEFAMIAVNGLGLSSLYASTPTFSDVPQTNAYYAYVEGAYSAGLVQGFGSGIYGPYLQIARQQVATVLARYLSTEELSTVGYITGSTGGHYASLGAWYASEGEAQLAKFSDQASIATVHRPGVAYLIMYGVALGSNGWFTPLSAVTQSQCESFVQRVAEVAAAFGSQAAAPTVTSISPATGASAGGTTVYVYGTNFTSDATVYFGSRAASTTVNSSTMITAVSPSGTGGNTVQVKVVTSAGTSANTSADDFTYEPGSVPTVTSVSPDTGTYGTTVYIYGTNFTSDAAVYFGSKAAYSATVNSSTLIVAVAPSGTSGTTVQVKVATDAGTSSNTSADDFTYKDATSAPTITLINPDNGEEGDTVYIYGTNFDDDDLEVWFGSSEVDDSDIDYYSSTMLVVIVPEHDEDDDETVRVKVVTDEGTSANTSADDFTYGEVADRPSITSVSPDDGWEGDEVTIRGTNFDEDDLEVYFGRSQVDDDDITYYSSTKLVVVAPEHDSDDSKTVRVKVTTDQGTSPNTSADDFTYEGDRPTITSVSPDDGWEGDEVTIHGTNFYEDSLEVYFGSSQVDDDDITYYSTSRITVVVPAQDSGDSDTVRVKVTTDYGTSSNTTADNFTYEEPTYTITVTYGANGEHRARRHLG